jgi:hypothetical protein
VAVGFQPPVAVGIGMPGGTSNAASGYPSAISSHGTGTGRRYQVPGRWSFDTGWHNMDEEYLHAGSVGAVIRAGAIFFLFSVLCPLRASTKPLRDVEFSVLHRLRSNAGDLLSRERILVTILCVIK